MTSILGSLSFAKLVMMSSAPSRGRGGGGCQIRVSDPFIYGNQHYIGCPMHHKTHEK